MSWRRATSVICCALRDLTVRACISIPCNLVRAVDNSTLHVTSGPSRSTTPPRVSRDRFLTSHLRWRVDMTIIRSFVNSSEKSLYPYLPESTLSYGYAAVDETRWEYKNETLHILQSTCICQHLLS